MINAVQFNPSVSIGVVVTSAIILLTLFGWFEWKRESRFLFLRGIALFIAIGSLVAFLLKPSIKSMADTDDLVVLTADYNKATADSLKKIYPHYQYVVTPEANRYGTARRLSANELIERKDQIRFVVGRGLPAYALPDSGFVFLKSKLPSGITHLNVPSRLIANRKATITGMWNGEATQLTLIGPGGRMDSTTVKPGQVFSLSVTPRQAGKFLFELEDGKKHEALPLEILDPLSLRILMLQQYPSAETRYLKNYLIDQGHQVIVRTQISKDNFRYEFGNESSRSLARITSDILADFDLLVLANESASQDGGAIATAIRNGLGVLWLPAESELTKPPLGFSFAKTNLDTARVMLESEVVVLPSWPVTSTTKSVALVANKNRILSGYKTDGAGKVGYQLLIETYAMIGKGQGQQYSNLWTIVIESLARTSAQSTTIRINNSFPIRASEPLAISLVTTLAEPELFLDSVRLPLLEHAVIDGYWSTTAWAIKPGWHQLISPKDSVTQSFFVPGDEAWTALHASNMQQVNIGRASDGLIQRAITRESYEPISAHWFFVLFVLAAGFLWLSPKL